MARHSFLAHEAIIQLRYAPGLRRAPAFGLYFDQPSTQYPTLYGKVVLGRITSGSYAADYVQALAVADFSRRINRVGLEQVRITAGKVWSSKPLPLSRLFAGSGFRNAEVVPNVFGGMLTMRPYDFYSDRFINLYLRHSFYRSLYQVRLSRVFSSKPAPALQYSLLAGRLTDKNMHTGVAFSVPYPAYHEAGILLDNLLRLAYLNLYYLTLNAGYFYHPGGGSFDPDNGVFAVGLGVDL